MRQISRWAPVSTALKIPRPQRAGGLNQETMNHDSSFPRFATPLGWHSCQRPAALTPQGRFDLSSNVISRQRHLKRTSAPRTAPCSRLSTLPTSSKSAGGCPLTEPSQCERPRCGYSTGLPVMAHGRFLTPTSCRPSRVLSHCANTTNASSSCSMSGGTSASPPVRLAQAGFRGPRIP